MDVCVDTFNIDAESFQQAILNSRMLGLKPTVVIVVDLFGQPADVDAITKIAHAEGIKVLVDGAQSFGATSRGRRVGSMGDATTTSFFPAKPLGCYGDGGAVFTSNDDDCEVINSIRLHGKGGDKYDNIRIGLNSRLDTLQAAILIEKLKIFPDELAMRNKVAENYTKLLSSIVSTPIVANGLVSTWAQYTLVMDDRDYIQSCLKTSGIPSIIYYPIPLSLQAGYKHFPTVSTGTPGSEMLSKKVLSLPMHPYLTPESQMRITDGIIKFLKN